MNIEELSTRLTEQGIDISKFGTGTAKTLDNLLEEINDGETEFAIVDNKLTRAVRTLSIDVVCEVNGQEYRLVEDRQVFTDGRSRQRTYLYGAVSEKLKPGEHIHDTLVRALQEELGVSLFTVDFMLAPESETAQSPSYPGLQSCYIATKARVYLHLAEYRAEGYQEIQGDKTTYFVWRERESV